MGQKTKKSWFRINKDVEYSTDFKFFSTNQIRIVRNGKLYSFCSRLESKTFEVKPAFLKNGVIDEIDLGVISRIIHKEIITGKHGKGKLVN